jgi:[CysO sulfur-carrier protein]-S-L-cysteine hydrolase
MAPDVLRLKRAHLAQMMAHVQQARPEEACGLLGGPLGQVERVYLVENIDHSPVSYQMDPTEQVRAMLEIEAAGWEITAIFHSHPAGPAVPSPTDVAQAFYPDAVYLIFAPDGPGSWGLRGFRIDQGRVWEVAVEVTE